MYVKPDDTLYGHCVLKIRFENQAEYLRWKKYNGGNSRWDFDTTFPAIMQATYDFHTTTDVNMISNKIVQLLQMGFNVYSADWRLTEYKSQLERKG